MRSQKDQKQTQSKATKTPKALAELYARALTALEEGKQSQAHKLFAEIVAAQPDYKDAALYVWLAREGVKADALPYKLRQAVDRLHAAPRQPAPPKTKKPPPVIPEPAQANTQEFEFEVITVNARGEEIERKPGKAHQYVEDLGNGVFLEMAAIPGGRFWMGSRKNEEGRYQNERARQKVTVAAFLMGKFPVTQEQWETVMESAPDFREHRRPVNPSRFKGAKRPVENVSWYDAQEFIKRLNARTSLPPPPQLGRGTGGGVYRLPTESEWEYACRAGTTTPFHFGDTITPALVNYNGNYPYAAGPKGVYRAETTVVGMFPPNAFGLYDMHGNVWEWCQDEDEQEDSANISVEAFFDSASKAAQVKRGGSWFGFARSGRSANRFSGAPGNRHDGLGFRIVRTLS